MQLSTTDVGGAIFYHQTSSGVKARPLEIDVAKLKPGVYFVKLESELAVQTLKFLKR